MDEYFNENERRKIKDIIDDFKERYNIQDNNFQKCIKFLFEIIDKNTDDDILDKTWNTIQLERSKPEFISNLFTDFCRKHECDNCLYSGYGDQVSCQVAFTIDYIKEHKELFEDN